MPARAADDLSASVMFTLAAVSLGLLPGLRPLTPVVDWQQRAVAHMCDLGGGAQGGDVSFWFRTAAEAAAEQRLRRTRVDADAALDATAPASSVYLVGVGPGDVELLTMKALRLMRSADLVLYDRLISPEVLSLVSADAAMLYVGKEMGLHTRPQEEIHRLLHLYATAGKTVVRLKGGDPTVFGRGGEELEYLEARGVPVQIVPGITAASGIAAALRVPLTHRDYADSVRFVTGHARSDNSAPVAERYQWEVLADPSQTLVVYMGLSTLPQFADGLMSAGLPGTTPAVAVQDGTTSTQRVVDASLGNLAAAVESAGLKSPTLIIIGKVIALLKRGEEAEASTAADAADEARMSTQLIEELTAAAVDGRRITDAAPAEMLSSVEKLLRLMR